jgi:low temperature requirement protein LtrA
VAGKYRETLWWTSIGLDYLFRILFIGFKPAVHRYAVNIEHHVERYGLLTIVVLGEVVVGFLFTSKSSSLYAPIAYVHTF